MSPEDKAVIGALRMFKLEKGQMLIFGPKSVAAVTQGFQGSLPDKYILEEWEWHP